MNRKIQPEVQAIFEKYVSGNTRRLVRDDAINMLMSEFIIERKWAEQFFTHFDADSNDVFSLWEFQHFYHVVGNSAAEIVSAFCQLDTDGKGRLSADVIRAELAKAATADGEPLTEKEIDFFMKSSFNEENSSMDIGHYADLLARIKVYKKPPKRK